MVACMGGQGPQGRKWRKENPFSWEEHLWRLTEEEFKLRYCLDFDAFQALLRIIGDDLRVHDEEKKPGLQSAETLSCLR